MYGMTLTPRRASGPYRPTRLGQWEVIAKIAGGGMSAVYLGRRVDSSSDLAASTNTSVVALKIVRHDAKDERFIQMFLEEGRLLARLVHPNIVRTLEVGAVIVNDLPTLRLDHLPYGGVKASGFGREGVEAAMEEMTEERVLLMRD